MWLRTMVLSAVTSPHGGKAGRGCKERLQTLTMEAGEETPGRRKTSMIPNHK